MATTTAKKPWRRANPKRKAARTTLSRASKTRARAAARRAGRPYPNLVDNMNAARKQKKNATARRRRS